MEESFRDLVAISSRIKKMGLKNSASREKLEKEIGGYIKMGKRSK